MLRRALHVLIPLSLTLGGCLPITLSVDPTGRVALARAEGIFLLDASHRAARVIHACDAGSQGAWAVFDDTGKHLLYGIRAGSDGWSLHFRSLAEKGKPVKILSGNNRLGYALLSPDGRHASIVTAPTFGKPSLTIHRTSDGAEVARLANVSSYHAWRGDGQALYILVAQRHDQAAGLYHGQLCRVDLGGKATPLFAVAAREDFHLDHDPRQKAIAVVAVAAAEDPKQKLAPAKPGTGGHRNRLFLYADGKLRAQPAQPGHHPRFAVFSPDGGKLLVNTGGRTDDLVVLDSDTLKVTHTLARDIPARSASLGDNATILPVWTPDGKSVIFWRYLPTMGLHGKSLRTRIVTLAGGPERDLEHRFEQAVYRALGR